MGGCRVSHPDRCLPGVSGKRGLSATLEAEVVGELDRLLGGGTAAVLDFEAVETAARRTSLRLMAKHLAQRLDADPSDHAGPFLPCRCGAPARYAGRQRKTFTTVLGPLTLSRAYYHCDDCHTGFFPRDHVLGIEETTLSPAVVRMVGAVGSTVSFAEGHALLWELAGIEVDTKTVERAAESLGGEIAQDERSDVEAAPAPDVPVTMYLGVDGTGAPMCRTELAGRAGKQPDGSAKTREVKLCTIWTAEGRDAQGVPVRDEGSVTVTAAIESTAAPSAREAAPFAQRVQREAQRRGFERAWRQVVVGDGAAWIWKLADDLFPDATQIVDRFHAKEHLHTVARALFGPGSERAKSWAHERGAELDAGKTDELITELSPFASTVEEARECIGYLQHNRERMRYPVFHAEGLCTSSGVVEAGCRVVVGQRLKRSGMHWTVRGANAILALRCSRLSGRFEAFWERRSERRRAA